MLASKYGESNGRINRKGRDFSKWWKDLHKIENGLRGSNTNRFFNKLRVEVRDGKEAWFWGKNKYSVKEAYKTIMEGISLENHRDLSVACNNLVPLKVAALVWRLLQNKIPSKDNFIKRGSLSESHSGGSSLCGLAESACHLFFDCPLYSALWHHPFLAEYFPCFA